MSPIDAPANRATLTRLIAASPEYMRPIIAAVRDHGVTLGFLQGRAPIQVRRNSPAIVVVGDDFDKALGPTAFHQEALLELDQRVRMPAD
jgi:hypothetical protein